jgi:hypothetical protein
MGVELARVVLVGNNSKASIVAVGSGVMRMFVPVGWGVDEGGGAVGCGVRGNNMEQPARTSIHRLDISLLAGF